MDSRVQIVCLAVFCSTNRICFWERDRESSLNY
jgi:hypothetical protein